MTEAETRASLIYKRLLSSGWDVTDHTKVVEEYTLSTVASIKDVSSPYISTLFSDYVLLGREGKRTSKDAELGHEQVKQHAKRMEKESGSTLPLSLNSMKRWS